MAKRKGAGKGSEFERSICKRLSLWWTGGERDDVFWRTSISGGRATIRSKQGKPTFGQHGDIQATDPIGQVLIDNVVIELKCGYGRACMYDILDQPGRGKQEVERWLEQVQRECGEAKVERFMLITKRNGRKPIIHINSGLRKELFLRFGPTPQSYMKSFFTDLVIMTSMNLEHFLDWVDPEGLKEIWA